MIGMFIGAILGFKTGGLTGLFFGAFIGSWAQRWVSENILKQPSRQNQIQQAYFQALFTSIGKLAKVDGIVTADEIQKCEAVMKKMQLSQDQRALAIKFFNQGKQDGFNISPILTHFARTSGRSFSIKQMFLEMMLEVASAGRQINQAEWEMLLIICEHLSFPKKLFVALVRMRGFNVHGQYTHSGSQSSHSNQQWQAPTQQKSNAYQILGVAQDDSRTVIRRAYKKLMSSHHPDKLIAKGLPPEMIEIAKNKTQDIQAAWESVKTSRGF